MCVFHGVKKKSVSITQHILELAAWSNITVGAQLCVQEGFLYLAGQLLLNFQISFFIAKVRSVVEFSSHFAFTL